MQHDHAVEMLSPAIFDNASHQHWADLGCGGGTFTLALAELLPEPSTVYAIDRDPSAIKSIPAVYNSVTLIKTVADFITDNLPAPSFDGMLLANALHYVKDQPAFIHRIATSLKPSGCLLLVEYDTNAANQWVPYPLTFARLKDLFITAGFSQVRKLSQRPSAFGHADLYAVQITR